MNAKKEQKNAEKKMLRQITRAAVDYSECLAGRDFLILYDGKSNEISFRADNFRHLCGVDTNLYATDFYRKALQKQLDITEIGFSSIHPKNLAELKIRGLCELQNMLTGHSQIMESIYTKTQCFPFGLSDGTYTLLFSRDSNSGCHVPCSFRSEDKGKTKCQEKYPIDFILCKESTAKTYHTVVMGEEEKLYDYLAKHSIFKYSIDLAGDYLNNEIEEREDL